MAGRADLPGGVARIRLKGDEARGGRDRRAALPPGCARATRPRFPAGIVSPGWAATLVRGACDRAVTSFRLAKADARLAYCGHGPARVTKSRFSLLHVEDDSLWQTSVAGVLRQLPEVQSYETVATASAARERACDFQPDLVLLDVVLADGDGLQLAREFAGRPIPPRILLLSVRRDDAVLQAAHESHVAALLWKSNDVLTRLPEAIRTVAAGGRYFPPEVREALRKFRSDPAAYFKILSDRELDLLPLFGSGLSDDEAAAQLGLKASTVKTHRLSILAKLNLSSTARLIHWAIQRGFVRPPSDGWVAREDGENASSNSSNPFS